MTKRKRTKDRLLAPLRSRYVVIILLLIALLWFVDRELESVDEDLTKAFRVAFDSDECLDVATSVICSVQEEVARFDCRENPRKFLTDLTRKATFTQEEREARELLDELDAVSIGAAKGGRCSDVLRNRRTLCTDRPQLDLFEIVSWIKLFSRRKEGVRVLHAEHVLEHFHPVQVQLISAAAFLMLKPGGTFRVAVPDGYKPSPSYQKYIRPGGTASGHGQRHMVAWTIDSLTPIFEAIGFEIVAREYFDDKGAFHTSEEAYQDSTLGRIRRSYREDKRNYLPKDKVVHSRIGDLLPDTQPNEPRYTSLWFDAIKPASCSATMVGINLDPSGF